MRGFIILAIVVCILWALDAYAFNGRYSQAVWKDASDQGQIFSDGIQNWLKQALPYR
jgi:hypothetical protein